MRVPLLLTLSLLFALPAAAEENTKPRGTATGNEIQLSITLLPQSLYVIGEPIPVEWKFTNTTGEPLGMFWEGCCFTYGEITAEDANHGRLERRLPPPPPTAPPGWKPDPKAVFAWHAFPMVTRIEPHGSVTFQTVLDNWLVLSRSGKFTLTARYTGAPESALKQRGPKLRLWNGHAEAKPFELELLTPLDYLKTGAASKELASTATASDPTLSLGGAALTFNFGLKSSLGKPVKLACQLWILDPTGKRIAEPDAAASKELELDRTGVTAFTLPAEALLGARLEPGFKAFVDLHDAANPQHRWPSAPFAFDFEADREGVIALIREAASKPGIRGERSPSMRMLRAYLLVLQPILNSAGLRDEFSTDAEKKLLDDLRLAAALKTDTDASQRVIVKIGETKPAQWSFSDSHIHAVANWTESMPADAAANDCAVLHGLRNHLGGQLAFEILPADQTRIGALRVLGRELARVGILDAATVRLASLRNKEGLRIHLVNDSGPNLLVKFRSGRIEFRSKTRDPNNPSMVPRFSAAEIDSFRAAPGDAVEIGAFREAILKEHTPADVRALLVLDDADVLNPGLIEALGGFGDVELSL